MSDRMVRVPLPDEAGRHWDHNGPLEGALSELLQEPKVIGFPKLGDRLLTPRDVVRHTHSQDEAGLGLDLWIDELALREWLRPKIKAEQEAEAAERSQRRPIISARSRHVPVDPELEAHRVREQALVRWSDQIGPWLLEDLQWRMVDRLDQVIAVDALAGTTTQAPGSASGGARPRF